MVPTRTCLSALLLSGLSLLGCLFPGRSFAQPYKPSWASLDKRPTPAWFDEAKFGIFIHWGLYSVPAWAETVHDPDRKDWKYTIHYAEWYWRLQRGEPGEWKGVDPYPAYHQKTYGDKVQYPDFVNGFTTRYFQPDQWAETFKNSGARYVVLTSKHHDGYCLWPSKQAWNWNSVDLNPHRDLVGDLSKAVRAAGLRMGLYYSLYEWYNPQYLDNLPGYVDSHMLPQMKDLVTRYQPELLYVDGEWDHPSAAWKSEQFLAWLYNESPVKDRVAVNDRWGKETRSKHGGYYTSEYGEVNGQTTGEATMRHKWDEIRGIGRSFGYNQVEDLDDYLSSDSLVHMLVDIVSKGGNLTLNVGPTAEGLIPVIMQQRLQDVGNWLKVNGEAIYGTTPWRVTGEGNNIRYTRKGNTVYAIAFRWPGERLVLAAPKLGTGAAVTLLGHGTPLAWQPQGNGVAITLPPRSPEDFAAPYAYAFKLEGVREGKSTP